MKTKLTALFLLGIALTACKKGGTTNPTEEEKPSKALSPYVSKIYEFKPAPGQFSNAGGTENTKILIGNVGQGLVSLGAYGGYIVFGFDHPITNKDGVDLGIYGNPLIGLGMELSEPGIVCVMQDINNNGLPDDTWHELAGSEYNASTTIKNYQITYYKPADMEADIRWTDNQGKDGLVLRNQFNTGDYFPRWAATNEITFTGTLVRNTLTVGDIITNKPLAFGYSDNGSSDYLALQDQFARGYNTFDFDWAVDSNGKKVDLKQVDFIKIYTGQNSNGNPFHPDNNNERSRYCGEISTEFAGAVDIKLLNKQQQY